MKLRNIIKIITFILLLTLLLISSTIGSISYAVEPSTLKVDTSYNEQLESINTILERNEQYEYIDSIIKNAKSDSNSYKLHVFCSENNDKELYEANLTRKLIVFLKFFPMSIFY